MSLKEVLTYRRINPLFILLWIVGLPLFGAVSSLQAQSEAALAEIKRLNLPISKDGITIHYSPGYEGRIAEVRPLIEGMVKFYNDKLKVKRNFAVVIVTKEPWERLSAAANMITPYGMPFVTPAPHLAFLPATSDNALTSVLLRLKDKASPSQLAEIKRDGFEFDSAAVKVVDIVGLHEVGHVYTLAYGINPPAHWINEFLASYFCYAFLKQERPNLASLYLVLSSIDDPMYIPKYTSLEDFERLYFDVGPENYAWYQYRLNQMVALVYERKSLALLADVRRAFPESEKGQIPPEVVTERLGKIDPAFVGWHKGLN